MTNRRKTPASLRYFGVLIVLAAVPCAAAAQPVGAGADKATSLPTFSRDVQPILQASCQSCHSAGGIGPMALTTYEEVRPWAPVIRERVERRLMPPWHVDPSVGIRAYENDISLEAHEIATIRRWVDGGSRRGDPADPPPGATPTTSPEWRSQEQLGPPDLILHSPPTEINASGQDQWVQLQTESGVTEDRFVRAIEVRPSEREGRQATHHVVLFTESDRRRRLLAEWAPGKSGEILPAKTGRRFPAGSVVVWDIHHSPTGTQLPRSEVELAIWFHPASASPPLESQLQLFRAEPMTGHPRGAHIDIPPGTVRSLTAVHHLPSAARIESFQPHMHLRGREMTLEAIYPDGRREILTRVDRFDHRWQISYRYDDAVMPLLPPGSSLVITAVHDNTAADPRNPDPQQWVGFGRRIVDEMAHAWIEITYLDDAELALLLRQRATAQENEPGQ